MRRIHRAASSETNAEVFNKWLRLSWLPPVSVHSGATHQKRFRGGGRLGMLSYVRDQEAKIVEFGGKVASGVLVLWSRIEGILESLSGCYRMFVAHRTWPNLFFLTLTRELDFSAATFHNSAIPLSTVFVGDCPVNLSASI